jgi:hypothetical protein
MLLDELNAMSLAADAAQPSDEDGVNTLLSMDDAPVRQKVGEAFVAQMQNAGRVQSTFFDPPPAQLAAAPAAQADWVGQVASALIGLSLGHTSGHGFAQTVNLDLAGNFLNANLTPANPSFLAVARSNYAALFPAHCATPGAGPVAFQAFLGPQAAHWGEVLAGRMKSTAFINAEMAKLNPAVDADGWYQRFYANLYKVTRLNNAELAGVLAAWEPYLKGREKPDQVGWTVYDHMVSGSYSYNTFFGQVLNGIGHAVSVTRSLGCRGGASAQCSSETTTTYGGAVNAWLASNHGFGGFINGPTSSNTEWHSNSGGGGKICCFTPGTPILMADGGTRPIEEIGAGEAVLSRDGVVFRRSDQDVHWRVADHDMLFGINDHPPFFNASHPFMTTAGWKSMSPRGSKEINPDIDIVGQLEVGDVLLQARSTAPFTYEEVRIERITRMLAQDAPDQRVYSLHLDMGNPGYHAHGFLVAVNYPTLREDHFVKAFRSVTDAERRYLGEHFRALAPFLRRGLGTYVSEVLRRALGGADGGEAFGAPAKVTHHAAD